MKVQIIITENHKKYLLKESLSNLMSDKIKEMADFTKKILKQSSEQIGVNLEFLFGWGAAIGGFMGPVSQFVKGQHPELSDMELSLIITAIISLYWGDNKELIRMLLKEIKSRKLTEIYREAKNKTSQLHNVFIKFVESLNVHGHKLTNIMSYTFLIPLLPMFWDLAKQGHFDMAQTKEIAIRIAGFATITVSGILMRNLLWKLIRRFSK